MSWSRWPLACLLIVLSTLGCEREDPDACPPAGLSLCDPVERRCCESGSYCFLRWTSGTFAEACVGGSPTAASGEACQPYATDGQQACSEGLVCLQVTGVDAQPVCHALCRDDSECEGGRCSEGLPGISALRACIP
jgi:hypothetical protein